MAINDYKAANLICNAFENGSGYWAKIIGYNDPETVINPLGEENPPKYCTYPFSEGGEVIIEDIEEYQACAFVLDRAAIEQGKKIIMEEYPHHYFDAMNDNDDAETADVFLQLCLFGEIVYG